LSENSCIDILNVYAGIIEIVTSPSLEPIENILHIHVYISPHQYVRI